MSFVFARRRLLPALLASAGLVLLASGPASAAASRIRRPVTDAPAAPATPPSTNAPQGGPLVLPLPENPMREIAPGVYEGIVPVLLPDGSWTVDLDERFHAFSVVRLGAGGGLSGSCVLGANGLARWQSSAATAACGHDHSTPAASAAVPKTTVRPLVSGPAATTVTTWEAR